LSKNSSKILSKKFIKKSRNPKEPQGTPRNQYFGKITHEQSNKGK
jgi:hypothetical protein